MRTRRPLWAIVGWLFTSNLSGCQSQGAPVQSPETFAQEDTTLGPGDVFEVRVYGEKDLSSKYQVGPDGSIQFPFIGTVQVSGKETQDVAAEIAAKLSEGQFLREPHVSVLLEQSNSKRISVIGAVAKPGTMPITPGMTVVQAISQAGGFSPLASKDDTVVTRRVNGRLERYRISVTHITRGDTEDFPLRAGDILFVPERVF